MGKLIIDVPTLGEGALEHLKVELGNFLRTQQFQVDGDMKREDSGCKLIQNNSGFGKTAKVTTKDSNFFVQVLYLPPKYLDSEDSIPREESESWEGCVTKRDRIWGYYSDYATAEKCVLENWTDIYEQGYYNLAVILEMSEGMCVHADEAWFRVDPIVNEDEVKRREERDKAWEEAEFFGKSLGKLLGRYLKNKGYDVDDAGIAQHNGWLQEIAAKIDIPWLDLYRIQAGEAAPVFSLQQWDALMTLVCIQVKDELELTVLRNQALDDPEHHGKRAILSTKMAWGSGPADGPSVQSEGWLIKGYNVKKIEKPKRFKNIAFGLG